MKKTLNVGDSVIVRPRNPDGLAALYGHLRGTVIRTRGNFAVVQFQGDQEAETVNIHINDLRLEKISEREN